ncbi:MAG: KEOPS complex subunit Pcc1 [Methermicoccaceae archaeon]
MKENVWAEVLFSELTPCERLAMRALSVDNTDNMHSSEDENLRLTVECTSTASLLATLDDYMRCLQLSLGVAGAVER